MFCILEQAFWVNGAQAVSDFFFQSERLSLNLINIQSLKIGHADFYVNGGTSQPGCASTTLFKTLACDHTKVTPYFIESINSERGFFAGPCRNLLSYVLGFCHPKDEEYVLMGEHCSPK